MDMNWVYILIGVLVFIFGGMIFFGGARKAPPEGEIAYKDGKPILPRHQRSQSTADNVEKAPLPNDDALSRLATVAESQVHKQTLKSAGAPSQSVADIPVSTPVVTNKAQAASDQSVLMIKPVEQTPNTNANLASFADASKSDVQATSGVQTEHTLQAKNSVQAQEQAGVQKNTKTMPQAPHPSSESTTQGSMNGVSQEINQENAQSVETATADARIQATTQKSTPKETFLVYDKEILPLSDFFLPKEYEALRNNDVLYDYKKTVTLVVSPKNSFEGIDGKQILRIAKDYGLKYGQLNLFHRYEDPKGKGLLWFSLLGVTKEGASPFDLNTLADSTYKEIAFFLPLPHPEALRGFDSMYQVASAVSSELGGYLFDEHRNPVDNEYKQALRQFISEYQG